MIIWRQIAMAFALVLGAPGSAVSAPPQSEWCALFPVSRPTGTGYIDTSGHLVIAAKFNAGGDFNDGMAPAQLGEKWGYIDCAGEWALPPQFESAQGCQEGYCRVSGKSYDDFGLVDRNGTQHKVAGLDGLFLPRDHRVVGWKAGTVAVRLWALAT